MHIESHAKPVRRAIQALYLEVPREVADDVRAHVESLIKWCEAYQSAVDLLLTAILQEGVKPECTAEFRNLAESAARLRSSAPGSKFVSSAEALAPGRYWQVHKDTGKIGVVDVKFSILLMTPAELDYYWIGPLSTSLDLSRCASPSSASKGVIAPAAPTFPTPQPAEELPPRPPSSSSSLP